VAHLRVVPATLRRHRETIEVLTHLHQHQLAQGEALAHIERRIKKLSKATDDLTREVQETREAVLAKVAAMQAKIDEILANPGDETAVIAAAEALNTLQGEITEVVQPADPVDPNA
jgi:hypothetical protein